MNKSFAGRFAIADKMCCGKSVEIINTLPARTILVPLNFGYEIVLTINTDTTTIMTSAKSALKIPER